jgi:hypothetical protein
MHEPIALVGEWLKRVVLESIKKWALLAAVWDLDFLRPAVK